MALRNFCAGSLFLASASLMFGQTDSNSLTVTVFHSTTEQPDQVLFWVNVAAPLNTNLDDVVAALAGSGITAADFSTVYSAQTENADRTQSCGSNLQWSFTLAVPSSSVKPTASMLTALQQQIGKRVPGSSMVFGVAGTQVSPQAQAAQKCPIPDLVANAGVEAQKLASAAGASVGPILALSDGSSNVVVQGFGAGSRPPFGSPIQQPVAGCTASSTSTTTTTTATGVSFGSISPAFYNPVSCVIVVKFSLLRP
jgi:hypothetical protein